MQRDAGFDRPERRAIEHVDLAAAAARAARACGTSARRPRAGSARRAARSRSSPSAKRSASTHGAPTQLERPASCRAPRRRSSLRTAPCPDRRSPSRASGCSATASPRAAPVASKYISRRQPSIATTSRSAPMPKCSLNSRASSPIVMPWRIGIGYSPTNDSNPCTSIGPSTASPPIGLGRSQTMTLTPCSARGHQAVRHRVDVGVDARADVLQIDDEHVDAAQHLGGRLARFAVERVDRHAAHVVARRARVSIMFSCTSDRKPCCGPKIAASARAAGRAASRSAMWRRLAIDRRRVADDADALAVEAAGREQPVGPETTPALHDYRAPRLASDPGALIDYAPLVVSPACFARAESRSSLKSDSLPPVNVQPTRATVGDRHERAQRLGANEE